MRQAAIVKFASTYLAPAIPSKSILINLQIKPSFQLNHATQKRNAPVPFMLAHLSRVLNFSGVFFSPRLRFCCDGLGFLKTESV